MTTWHAVGEQVVDGEMLRCVSCHVPVYVPAWKRALLPTATRAMCGACRRAHRERREP